MLDYLTTEIKFLKGVGPKRAELFQSELGINTFRDLLYYFPFRYIDRSKYYTINELNKDLPYIQIRGKFSHFEMASAGKFKKKLSGFFADNTGVVEIVWFQGTNMIKDSIKPGIEYVIFGKPSQFGSRINIIHPEIEEATKHDNSLANSLVPQYRTSEKLKKHSITSRTFRKLLDNLLKAVNGKVKETFPPCFREMYKLMGLEESLREIHFPSDVEQLKTARYRQKFEELFFIQLSLQKSKIERQTSIKGFVFDKTKDYFVKQCFHKNIPFKLTNAQTRVLRELREDFTSGHQMNRLLQGDVGSGKTLVALLSMLIAVDNGFQACIMAPTEILAQQHFQSISKFLKGIDLNIRLLTGSVKTAQRKEIHQMLEDGSLHILIGTHALIEDNVIFKNLGYVVIDEQHRFGVSQRAKLWKKNTIPPHILVMTATPIPRTLAMTLYGDLDISVIDELPPGRTKIITTNATDAQRLKVFGFMKKQIALGRQIYLVYPLISESEAMDYKDLEDGVESISRAFPIPDYQISVVHGKMKSADKEFSMQRFAKGETHILIATTVIEVGVDIPNASVMIIESAERFGLSQLHQLRGRVGRGAEQSYCILMTSDKLSENAYKRISVMVQTTDGFEIAEEDLKLRGPGDIEGTQQSGFAVDLKIADLSKDGQIIQYVKNIATDIISDDPLLKKHENAVFIRELKRIKKVKPDMGLIS